MDQFRLTGRSAVPWSTISQLRTRCLRSVKHLKTLRSFSVWKTTRRVKRYRCRIPLTSRQICRIRRRLWRQSPQDSSKAIAWWMLENRKATLNNLLPSKIWPRRIWMLPQNKIHGPKTWSTLDRTASKHLHRLASHKLRCKTIIKGRTIRARSTRCTWTRVNRCARCSQRQTSLSRRFKVVKLAMTLRHLKARKIRTYWVAKTSTAAMSRWWSK